MQNTVSLNSNHEFRRLYQKGKSAVSPFLAVYCRKKMYGARRLGITVSTKVGKAVVRNRVRRRIREAYRLHELQFCEHVDVVIVARVRCVRASFQQIEKSLLQLAEQLGLLKEPN